MKKIVFLLAFVLILFSCEQTDWNEKMNHKCEVCGAVYSELAFSECPYHSVCASCGRWYNNLKYTVCPYCGSDKVVGLEFLDY